MGDLRNRLAIVGFFLCVRNTFLLTGKKNVESDLNVSKKISFFEIAPKVRRFYYRDRKIIVIG